ncbi:MAG: flagellar biosynthesis protein FliQ [Caldicoprobacterales bacterium]|nr:flagellar biosynthesis protein FliQ [Clostridiales bacterium]
MSEGQIITIAQQAIYTGIIIAAPMLGLGLIVGLIVAVFQATTQINEQTLVFIPKILAVAIALLLFGPWIIKTMTEFTTNLYDSINLLTGL